MKTMFKIFEIKWNIAQLERIIKRYQEELRLEVKSVTVLREYSEGTAIGVIFEKSSEYEEPQDSKSSSDKGICPDSYKYAGISEVLH